MTVKTALLTLALAIPFAAVAADVPTTYTVNDTALKAAVAGTNLTFTLYTDAACTQQAFQQVVPIETVAFVSRLKTFTPKSAPKGPKIDEVHETLTGVSAAGNLYLTVTGTGITPVGGACQAQATVQPPAPVVRDANGLLVGSYGGADYGLGQYVALRSVGSVTVAIEYYGAAYSPYVCVFYQNAGCTGPALMGPTNFTGYPYGFGVVSGTTLYYPSSGPAATITVASQLCGSNPCVGTSFTSGLVPATATTVPAFTLPFHVEVP